jgi:hypothetical protein
MLDESVFVIQGEDVNQVKALLFSQVVNCDKEWDESETINSEFPRDAWASKLTYGMTISPFKRTMDTINFRFYWCSVSVYLEFSYLHWFPSEQSFLKDVLAFLNGGFKSRSEGYWFISDEGLMHFAFLTNQVDEYQYRWRLKDFAYHAIKENARNHMNGF